MLGIQTVFEGDNRVEGLFVVICRQPLLTSDPLIYDITNLVLDFSLDLILALLSAPLELSDIVKESLLHFLVHSSGATFAVLQLTLVLFD